MPSDNFCRRVFKTIEKYRLIKNGDVVYVGMSGGKDSAAALYCLKRYAEENGIDCRIIAFHLKIGQPKVVEDIINEQIDMVGVEKHFVSFEELGISLPEAAKRTHRPICSVCGVAKRYLMNKIPRECGATKFATGHNMDDFLMFFFKNLLGKNYFWISKFKPKLKSSDERMLTKIRPLFHVTNSDVKAFCDDIGIPLLPAEANKCIYLRSKSTDDGTRAGWYEMLEAMDGFKRGFRQQLISSVIDMGKFFEMPEIELKSCKICGEPSSKDVCTFCSIFRNPSTE